MALNRILAIANQKGGVGKTTTAVSIAVGLATLGFRVILIDFDSQANASSSLGINPRQIKRSIYDVLCGRATLSEVLLDTEQPGLSLAPSAPALAGGEVELAALPERETVLKEALSQETATDCDIALLDCPPSLGLLTLNALTAANSGVVIPVQCEYLALEGLSHLTKTIEAMRVRLNPNLVIVGILMTMYDMRTNLANEVVQEVRQFFPGLVFRDPIPRSVRISEAPSQGQSIYKYAPGSAGAAAYSMVVRELVERLKLTRRSDGGA